MKKVRLLPLLAAIIVVTCCGLCFAEQTHAVSPASSYAVDGGVTFIIHEIRCSNSMLTLQIERRPSEADTALIDNQVEAASEDPSFVRQLEEAQLYGSKILGTLCDVLTLTDENGESILSEYQVSTIRRGSSLTDTFRIFLPKEPVKQVTLELALGASKDLQSHFPQASTIRLTIANQQSFLTGVAQLTLENGDYQNWPIAAKRALIQLMKDHGLISREEAAGLSGASESCIDESMLARYGSDSLPGDVGAISLIRMAAVEMGIYTDWPNETWTWFSQMMFETGLWNETNDVDVYETPGDEAISPEKAVVLAKQHLLTEGVSADVLDQARIIWHYTTHASDVERKELTYLITFRFADGHEQYVFLAPDGQIRS